jgi:osmotically-inducible protein OsmY
MPSKPDHSAKLEERPMHAKARLLLALIIVSQLTACAALVVGGVAATGMALHDRRSLGTVIDDNVLEVRVRDALYRHEQFNDEVRIKVQSHNGWVLLAGEAVNEERVALAERAAGEIEGVRRLFNELAPIERGGPGLSTSDRWISTRVNGSLTRIRDLPGFDATRVKVTTARGIVYLMGLVSREEAEAVVAQARTVRGVERVVTLFEYLDEVS